MTQPFLSIVIANYNYGRFLEDAIRSVLDQGMGDEVELIICDAASTDNSVEIIKKYANGLPPGIERYDPSIGHLHLSPSPIVYWCSEPDGGQSAAFNKGFLHARGKYLTWLNADDVLVAGCGEKILAAFRAYPQCEWFTGNFYRFSDCGDILEIGWGPHWYPQFLQLPSSPLVIFGPTTFFSREVYERVGRIDEGLHYIMDNDLWYRFMLAGVKQRRINCFCWAFRMHADSKTAEYGSHVLDAEVKRKMRQEKEYVLRKTGYTQSAFLRWILLAMRVLDGSIIRKWYYRHTFKRRFK